MARDQVTVVCDIDIWTQITNANVSALTFQTLRGEAFVRATVGEVTPTEVEGIVYRAGKGEPLSKLIAEYITLSGANRIYVKPVGKTRCAMYVDHA